MNNASDRKSIRRAEKALALATQQDREIITSIMSTTAGREWAMRRLNPVFTTPYTPDPNATAFNCGIQNEAIRLLSEIISACPDEFILAMREQNERNSTAATRERSSSEDGDGRDNRSGEGAVDGTGEGRAEDRDHGGDYGGYEGSEEFFRNNQVN